MKTRLSRFYTLVGLCLGSFVLLIWFLVSYSPDDVGFLVTLLPLTLSWIFLATLLQLTLRVIRKTDSTVLNISSFIVPSIIVLGLMFSALGEVSVLDAILLFILAALGNFYLARTWPK